MQLVLLETTEVTFKKTYVDRRHFEFSFTAKANNSPDDIDDHGENEIMSELRGDAPSAVQMQLDSLGKDQYGLEVWCCSGFGMFKHLRNRFPDLVLISVEINSPCPPNTVTERNDDDLRGTNEFSICCLSSGGMAISEHGICRAHSNYINIFDLDTLNLTSERSAFHVKVIAHIYADAYQLKKTPRKILEEGMASDVIIQARNGVEIKAHKCFLMSTSSVFQRMFTNEMTESKSGRVDMTGTSEEAVKAFLKFIYHGDVIGPTVNIEVAYELFGAAHKYDVPELEAVMQTYLVERGDEEFSVDLAFEIYSFVKGIENASELKDKVVRIMSIKLDELKELPEFKEVFQKNPSEALEMCCGLVGARTPTPMKRKMEFGQYTSGKRWC